MQALKMKYQIRKEEVELIEGCLANNRRSQKALYNRYKNGMYTVAYRIVNDRDDAHDVLQNAFVQVFRDLSKFRRESSLGAWVKIIVVRSALKKLKQRKNMEPLDENYDEPVVWNDNLTGEYLDKAIRSLPDGYRAVFLLIEVEGYAHKEVAEMLNISTGTSKSQLYYAKKRLQKIITEMGI